MATKGCVQDDNSENKTNQSNLEDGKQKDGKLWEEERKTYRHLIYLSMQGKNLLRDIKHIKDNKELHTKICKFLKAEINSRTNKMLHKTEGKQSFRNSWFCSEQYLHDRSNISTEY